MHKISRRLTTHQLRRLREKDIELGYGQLFSPDTSSCGSPYFLGYYSPSGIRYALEKYGFFKELHQRGFNDLKLVINTDDPYKQQIKIYEHLKQPGYLLGELVLKKKYITVYSPFPSRVHGRHFEVVAVEWLCMQNPGTQFSPERPRLPGQKYPGLGMGDMVMEILVIMCGRLRTAGLLNVPEHFHNAQMYSSQFFYLHPLYEAKRAAIERDLLQKHSLSTVSWAIDLGCVLENDQPFQWFIADQIVALDRDLKEYVLGKAYSEYVKQSKKDYSYRLVEEKWLEKQNEIENYNNCRSV